MRRIGGSVRLAPDRIRRCTWRNAGQAVPARGPQARRAGTGNRSWRSVFADCRVEHWRRGREPLHPRRGWRRPVSFKSGFRGRVDGSAGPGKPAWRLSSSAVGTIRRDRRGRRPRADVGAGLGAGETASRPTPLPPGAPALAPLPDGRGTSFRRGCPRRASTRRLRHPASPARARRPRSRCRCRCRPRLR